MASVNTQVFRSRRNLKPALFLALMMLTGALGTQHVAAYVDISVDVKRNAFLRYEPVQVAVTIRNFSGNPLDFGKRGEARGGVEFSVFRQGKQYVAPKQKEFNFGTDLFLPAGASRRLEVSLNRYYNLQRTGSYHFYVKVKHDRFSNAVRSQSKSFTIKDGIEIWSKMVGAPSSKSGEIPVRKMTLMTFSQKKKGVYALRIEDKDKVYATIRLGRRIMVGTRPEFAVDGRSNFHILLEVEAKLYVYRVVSWEGELEETQYFMAKDTIPHLQQDDTLGTVSVNGGTKATPGVDFELKGSDRDNSRAPQRSPRPGR